MLGTRHPLLRDFEAGRQLDLLLVAAISAVLGIRFGLVLTGYPTLGGEGLHIAHMLWGGFLMLAAIVLLISFVGRGPHRLAAFVGGLGFGTFIDEIGKFVTHDNDYFYEPAVSIIYVVFVVLYLAIRSLHRERIASPAEYLANAIVELQQVAVSNLDRTERDRALEYLDRYGSDRPPAPALRSVLMQTALVSDPVTAWTTRAGRRLGALYRRLTFSPWFTRALIALFAFQLLTRVLRGLAVFVPFPRAGERLLDVPVLNPIPSAGAELSLLQWLLLGSNALSSAFLVAGLATVARGSLTAALRHFQRAVLVTLLLTQVFVFYRVEWLGLAEFAVQLLVFFALRFMIERERTAEHRVPSDLTE